MVERQAWVDPPQDNCWSHDRLGCAEPLREGSAAEDSERSTKRVGEFIPLNVDEGLWRSFNHPSNCPVCHAGRRSPLGTLPSKESGHSSSSPFLSSGAASLPWPSWSSEPEGSARRKVLHHRARRLDQRGPDAPPMTMHSIGSCWPSLWWQWPSPAPLPSRYAWPLPHHPTRWVLSLISQWGGP